MKAITRSLFTTLALFAVATAPVSAFAKGKQSTDPSAAEKKKMKAQMPFDVPSRNKPEPKTCGGRCDMDKGDCDAMCKSVQGQGAAPCKKACVDVQKQCMDSCKGGG